MTALDRGQTYALDRAAHPPLPLGALGLESPPEAGAYLLLPLSYQERLLGSLNLIKETSLHPRSWHQSMTRQIADALAVALHHASVTGELAGR